MMEIRCIPPTHNQLTLGELEIVGMLAAGRTDEEIAASSGVDDVPSAVKSIAGQLGFESVESLYVKLLNG